MKPVVVDLSHHNIVTDFKAAKAAGLVGVIHKATQGTDYVDPTYAPRKVAALDAGLLWGAYHFGTGEDPEAQLDHFLSVAGADDGKTLLALDFEENPNKGGNMSLTQAKAFLNLLMGKAGQRALLYSGNLLKEKLDGKADPLISQHRLWLAEYGAHAIMPPGFECYWLWQYTGDGIGPEPHGIDGIAGNSLDLNVFGGSDIIAEWIDKNDN